MFSILLSLEADAKIVCNEGKADGSGFVEEQSRGMLGREMAMLCKVFFQLVVGQFARLSETMDSPSDLDVHTAIGSNLVCEMVLIDDLLGDVFQLHFHAFIAISEFCVQMHV